MNAKFPILDEINRIFQSILRLGSEEEAGDFCLSVAKGMTGSKFGFIGEVGPDRYLREIAVSNSNLASRHISDQTRHSKPSVNLTRCGLYGLILERGEAFFTNNPASHPDSVDLPPGHPPLSSFLGVPLIKDNHIIGIIAVGNREGGYTHKEQQSLDMLAPAIVAALQYKRNEASLIRQKREVTEMLESLQDGFFAIDRNWQFTYMNHRAAAYLGFKPEDLIGKTLWEKFPQIFGTKHEKCIRKAMDLRETQRYETADISASKRLNVSICPLDEGLAVYWLEVAERKRLEEEIIESRAIMEAALASMTDAVLISDVDGNFVKCNDALSTFFRFKNKDECAEALAGYFDILEAYTVDGVGLSQDLWAVPRALRGEIEASTEYILCRKDTGEIWIASCSFAPIRDKKGVIIGAVVIGRDITESKRTEEALRKINEDLEAKVRERTLLLTESNKKLMSEMEARERLAEELRESEETYRLLYKLNLAGTYRSIFDPATRKTTRIDCNDAYARMLGFSSKEELLADATFTTSFATEDEKETYIRHLLKDMKVVNYETRRMRKDGKPIWILTNASLRPMKDREEMLLEGTIVDISARKKAEEEMRSAHERLRAIASEMIHTEARERQHIATVLHDTVAQTLAAAKLRFESAQEHVSSKGLKLMAEARELIAESIRQTRSIMSELSPPILYELGFIPALESLIEQVKIEHGIHIKFDNTGDFDRLASDIEVLLYTSTREIIMNIVKHAKSNNAKVAVSEKDGRVRIEVRDYGIGIDKARIGYRKDLSGGFGLFSIQERLKHFGGEFDIESQREKGTKITITIPRATRYEGNN